MSEDGEGEVVDPLSVAGGKTAQAIGDEIAEATGNLLARMFGPAADVAGKFLADKLDYRLNNAERIAQKAQRKAKEMGRENGVVAQRLSYTMLDEGTYTDDELMAEYLGGVLASGRTPTGKDDRGVTWTKLITSMSSIQVRAHFLLYREWAYALHGLQNDKICSDQSPGKMYIDLEEFVAVLLDAHPDVQPGSVIPHVIGGLARLDLIGDNWWSGPLDSLPDPKPVEVPFPHGVVQVLPSHAGIELYGWASGRPGFGFREFISCPDVVDFDAQLPRIEVLLPHLRSTEVDAAEAT